MHIVLLQHGANPNIRNSDGKSVLDLADSSTRPVLTGKIIFNIFKCNELILLLLLFVFFFLR